MDLKDETVLGRFPVGYYSFHPNVSLNFQMNRFWNWVGDKQMLEELKAVGTRISNYDDWAREMSELSDSSLAAGRRLPAAYYAKMAIFFLDPSDARVKPAFQRFMDIVLNDNGVTSQNHHLVPYQGKQLSAYRFTPREVRGKIVVFGGSKYKRWFADVLVLDVATSAWETMETTGKVPALAYHSCTLYDRNLVLVFGGIMDSECSDTLFCLDIEQRNWFKPFITGERPCARSG